MIISIGSSIKTFKPLKFKKGLNILLADTQDEGDSGRTRNSAGKSSFVQIVDFLLGANCPPKSVFRSDALNNASFSGVFNIEGRYLEVERKGDDQGKIFLLSDPANIDADVQYSNDGKRPYLKLNDWRRFLGKAFFGFPQKSEVSDFSKRFAPTYRAIMGYFLRQDNNGGFITPEKNSKDQQRYSYQACLSYIFGLEWRLSQDFQNLREKEKELETLRKAARGGMLEEAVGTVAKLRPLRAEAKQRVKTKRELIDSFEVLDSYKEISEQAATCQRKMQILSQRLVSFKETLQYLITALEDERPTQSIDVRSMYDAIGIELPELALRRFEEVAEFQASIIKNRELHLKSEIDETKRQIARAETDLIDAGAERKELLSSLEGKGAFDDLKTLQKELAVMEAEYALLEERFKAAELLESDKAELQVDRIELQRRMQADHATHSELLDTVTLRIRNLIDSLYGDREGGFEINATENGPEFEAHIEGDRGTGIRSMEIFCLDIAIFEAVRSRYVSPGFLIHDSHLFDGVDARQIRSAILLGLESVGDDAQYIVTLNSDIYDSLGFSEEDGIASSILYQRLSDGGDEGGLFGFRFD